MQYWLLKTEPEEFSISNMEKESISKWDGVKNNQAQKYMKTMKIGDLALFYHTGKEKAIVGVVKIVKEYFYDKDPKFGVVEVEFYKTLKKINLGEIKQNTNLKTMIILKQPRLSVSPVTEKEWNEILLMSAESK